MKRPESIRKTAPKTAGAKDSTSTRTRIFEAAQQRFSQSSYEAVGVREIAGDAGVDASLVIRYFGSKEGLFREVAAHAFESHELFEGDASQMVQRMVQNVLAPGYLDDWRRGYDPFRLLLCSISSVTAGPIISEAFQRSFLGRLAGHLHGRRKDARAALIASYVLGTALLRLIGQPSVFEGGNGVLIAGQLSEALDRCVAGDDR